MAVSSVTLFKTNPSYHPNTTGPWSMQSVLISMWSCGGTPTKAHYPTMADWLDREPLFILVATPQKAWTEIDIAEFNFHFQPLSHLLTTWLGSSLQPALWVKAIQVENRSGMKNNPSYVCHRHTINGTSRKWIQPFILSVYTAISSSVLCF